MGALNGRNGPQSSQDNLDEYRTPTQQDYLPNGLSVPGVSSSNTERGRSSQSREADDELPDEQIARQDYAPMVNGNDMRRLSEPTSI